MRLDLVPAVTVVLDEPAGEDLDRFRFLRRGPDLSAADEVGQESSSGVRGPRRRLGGTGGHHERSVRSGVISAAPARGSRGAISMG